MKTLCLQEAVPFYLESRHRLGFALQEDGRLLSHFVAYVRRRDHRGPLTTALALSWAQGPPPTHLSRRARRLNAVRHFALFWAAFDPRTQVPPAGLFGPAYRRGSVHLYTAAQIAALLAQAQKLPAPETLWPRTMSTLLGLLACTGLRMSEALHLHREDWEPSPSRADHSPGEVRPIPLRPGGSQCRPRFAGLWAGPHPGLSPRSHHGVFPQ